MKIIGMLVLLCSGFGIARCIIGVEERSLLCTRALLALLVYTRDCVAIWGMSVSEILAKCDKKLMRACGISENAPTPVDFVQMCERCMISDKDSKEAFVRFSHEFGKSYREQELKKTDQCIEKLKSRAESMERRLPQKKKMVYGVCISASLVLLILFI